FTQPILHSCFTIENFVSLTLVIISCYKIGNKRQQQSNSKQYKKYSYCKFLLASNLPVKFWLFGFIFGSICLCFFCHSAIRVFYKNREIILNMEYKLLHQQQ